MHCLLRDYVQVKTYDESRAEQELLEEATREAARVQANGYEDTHCQVCHSKVRPPSAGATSPCLQLHPTGGLSCVCWKSG